MPRPVGIETNPRRADVEAREKYLRSRVKRLRRQLKESRQELISVQVMLMDGDFSEFRAHRFPTRGTKWRQAIEILAEKPDHCWTIDELMPRVGLDPNGGYSVREMFRARMYALLRRGNWVEHVEKGRWKITEASLLKLKKNPR